MKKIFKLIFSYEPLIIWFRYFYTLTKKYLIINFILPLIFCISLGIWASNTILNLSIDVFTISSIFIGFAISVLVMLLTTENENMTRLKNVKLTLSNVSLHQAMVYKFAFIIYNLVFLILFSLILNIFNIKNIVCSLIIIYILINSLLTIIEATSNIIFTFIRKD